VVCFLIVTFVVAFLSVAVKVKGLKSKKLKPVGTWLVIVKIPSALREGGYSVN